MAFFFFLQFYGRSLRKNARDERGKTRKTRIVEKKFESSVEINALWIPF